MDFCVTISGKERQGRSLKEESQLVSFPLFWGTRPIVAASLDQAYIL
ncbi:unnamed protein product [Coffea canephora]|uniref:Uncharacterized protein n=1 Tax=Coffea canephora TaxID=49390 RepID=A0A068V609_COFCA|nr:unnamed protein product [Coffea canephora]